MSHAHRAARFVADAERTGWHDEALWFVRQRRDRAVARVPEWEALRERAAAVKQRVLADLPGLWERFEARARQRGIQVHWARDAEEHNGIVLSLLRDHGVGRAVKSKSMLTEECGLNAALEREGIEIVDTDLGERIVQLRREPPSHIVMPAIHLRRQEVGALFAEHLGGPPGLDDPVALTRLARVHLRERFLSAEAGLTGVNFALADTGGLVVCTNEGNADLGTALPPLHVASVGLEKILPGPEELALFLRLLARSATGQAQTAYTSHFHGPRPGGELHLVIVDNGRSRLLARPAYRDALACIRCGACLNTCPVYRRSGGHSYASPLPGPIGSVLGPAADPERHASLPHACSLCGSCSEVCPVKIPLHRQLLTWRGELARRPRRPRLRRLLLGAAQAALSGPRAFAAAGRLARGVWPWLPAGALERWTGPRELPRPARRSFRARLAERERDRVR